MKIYIGCDHRGVNLKKEIIESLKNNYEIIDTKLVNNETDDYPDFAFEVGENVIKTPNSLGILICGNGIGISIAANKVKNIRCARVINEDDALKCKSHNGCNVIAIASTNTLEEALKIIDIFINTPITDNKIYLNRINKIINYEKGTYNEL